MSANFQVGKNYSYHYSDGYEVIFEVLSIDTVKKRVNIRFENGASNFFSYHPNQNFTSSMDKNSVLVM